MEVTGLALVQPAHRVELLEACDRIARRQADDGVSVVESLLPLDGVAANLVPRIVDHVVARKRFRNCG